MDTIDGMRTFQAVVSLGSFSAAAERLAMSPQLVSKYVRQLEARLDVRLLNRTTRSLGLTEAGHAYYERCSALLADFDELEAAIQDTGAQPAGTLVVSAPITFGESRMAPAVVDFVARHPRIRVDLRLSDRTVNLVDEGYDLAVRIGELEDSSLIARRLGQVKLIPCAAPEYLQARPAPSRPAELSDHECIVDLNLHKPQQWPCRDENGEDATVHVGRRIAVNSARAVRNMAIRGAGIALCPDFAVSRDLREGRLRALLEDYDFGQRGLYAVYPHNRHLAGKVRAFVDFLVERWR